MPRFVLLPKESVVRVVAHTPVRPYAASAPVSGHFDAHLLGSRLDLSRPPGGELRLQVRDLRGFG